MDMDQALQTFIEESRELLAAMEDALLTLEASPGDSEAIGAVFRAMHTIKGSAGLFGLDHVVAFTHVAESVMDKVRAGELVVDDDLAALLLASRDHIGALMDRIAAGEQTPDPALETAGAVLLATLRRYLDGEAAMPPAGGAVVQRPDPVSMEGGGLVESDTWHISVRFGEELFRNGFDPLSFVRYLGTLGTLVHVETLSDRMPAAEAMDPESCYLGFEIRLASGADKETLESAFEFVQDDCTLAILPPHSHISEYVRLIEALPEDNSRLGEILTACGALTPRELAQGLALQAQGGAAGVVQAAQPLGEILVENKLVQPEVVGAALEKQQQVRETKSVESRAIRVDAAKLDELINMVGELVIAGAGASMLANRCGDGTLQEAVSLVGRLVEEIRDGALRLRMVQIGETFHRFNRVVRDVSKELNKDIALVISGAETELDKSVVEKISDPLMHLVRNAMDHGIEPAEVRTAAGKPEQGRLTLNAYHDSGSIVIEVLDDGRGLDRERILQKAVERGIIAAGQTLNDYEIYQLIFEPGFSTAQQVSNLSGRGVGMDVVKKNIEALRGTVELDSRAGAGTAVRIRLPLTLAIIDGFLVGVSGAAYVVPLDMVLECVELSEQDRLASDQRSYVNLRGEVLPFIRLRDHFAHHGEQAKRENVVVVQYAGQKAGIVVDELLGEFQTVIKPLGQLFAHLQGIGGSTILGSGEVALILDVPSLIQRAANLENKATAMSRIPATV